MHRNMISFQFSHITICEHRRKSGFIVARLVQSSHKYQIKHRNGYYVLAQLSLLVHEDKLHGNATIKP